MSLVAEIMRLITEAQRLRQQVPQHVVDMLNRICADMETMHREELWRQTDLAQLKEKLLQHHAQREANWEKIREFDRIIAAVKRM